MAATTDIISADDLCVALQTVSQVREQSLALLSLVQTVQNSNPGGATPDQTSALYKADKNLRAQLAQLRGRNRKAILNTRDTKQATGAWRQEVDELHLSLQNLYYEQRHLRGEIAACRAYNHKYLELPLIDVEEFLGKSPERADDSADDLMVARIDDERATRQAFEEERLVLAAKKEALKKRNAAAKAELERFDGDMEKWLNGAGAIGRVFEARATKKAEAEEKERKEREREEEKERKEREREEETEKEKEKEKGNENDQKGEKVGEAEGDTKEEPV
ncbi:hypothetical protein MBLNU230_g0428t1 [Neophaeotheca triangularis]